jgi:hypothetical protein
MATTYIDVTAAIKEAEAALKAKYEALERVAVLREVLRNAVKMKAQMTDDQRNWIEGQFPVRERNTTPEDRAKALREQAKEIEDKAKAKAAEVAA